jgi:U32 family peptidase
MSYRDANQGVCDNSCRYGYNVHKSEKPLEEGEYYLEDLRNKGEFYRIDEDEHGTYIMNAKDLCVIENLKEMRDAGIISFKVEGRTKSVHYAAQVARIYRKAIDDLEAGKPFDQNLLVELEKVANRGYHKGFIMGQPTHEAQDYNHSVARHFTQKFAGVSHKSDNGDVWVEVRNRISVGDQVEVITPEAQFDDEIVEITNPLLESVTTAHGGTGNFKIKLKSNTNLPDKGLLSQKLKLDEKSN